MKGGETMRRSIKIVMPVNDTQSNLIGHMEHAAYKLWNVAQFKMRNWKGQGYSKQPGMYDLSTELKNHPWYKSLPSQSAQQTIHRLCEAWKSYYTLKAHGFEEAKPPKFKHAGIAVCYIQNGIQHNGGDVRLALPAKLKDHMKKKYGITEPYLYLRNEQFAKLRDIKTITLKMRGPNKLEAVVVYQVPDVPSVPDNGHYLGIDPGVKNLFACYDSVGKGFLFSGKRLIHSIRYFEKEIAKAKSENDRNQDALGFKHHKNSKRINWLYKKRRDAIKDYLHKTTTAIANYCEAENISCVVIGDITGIREDNDKGKELNQVFHAWPYRQATDMLRYKLADRGIPLIQQEESYTSQCGPSAPYISKRYAKEENRVKRGLYLENGKCYNADMVGARNILRKAKRGRDYPLTGLSDPINVTV